MAANKHKLLITLITTLTLFSPACLAAGYADYSHAGETAYGEGNRAEAEKNFKLALKEAEVAGPSNLKVAEALQNLGVIYDETKRYDEAEAVYKRALAIRESCADQPTWRSQPR